MTETNLERFERNLARNDVTSSRTTQATFESAVTGAIERPAIGVPMPFPGVSLDGCPVHVDSALDTLESAVTGVTPALMGIASLGTVAIRSTTAGDEPVSLFPERHVVVLRESDVVASLGDAFDWLGRRLGDSPESVVFATGPSATGDMGGMVKGVHGPKEVHVILLVDDDTA